jgi:hypothetical protein
MNTYKKVMPLDVPEFEYLLEYEMLSSWWATSIFVAWVPDKWLREFVWWYYTRKVAFKFKIYKSRRSSELKRERQSIS